MSGELNIKDIINFNDWPARVDAPGIEGQPLVVQALSINEMAGVGIDCLRSLHLSDEVKHSIAQRAGLLGLLDEGVA